MICLKGLHLKTQQEYLEYGPLRFLIGSWQSDGFSGENRAPDPDRKVENTKFRQEMTFKPVGAVNNHEQTLQVLRYETKAWEASDQENAFHEEVGYFIWDKMNEQIMKSFIVPRGISIQAGGDAHLDSTKFSLKAELGSPIYGLCSNKFLDEEFKTLSYEVQFQILDQRSFSYVENTRIKIKGNKDVFDHIERNTMFAIKNKK